jgi:hypothetical protein
MTKREIRQMEMLVRVRDFGTAHALLFPKSTIVVQSLAAIDEAVKQLTTYTGSRVMATRGSAKTKYAARAALRDALRAVNQTARAIAAQDPAFQNKFQMPRRQAAPVLVMLARSFAQHAEPLAPRFIERGMPATFLADLTAAADAYETAVRGRDVAKQENSEAQALIQASIAAGLSAVDQLDVVVANSLRDNPGALAKWMQARRIPHQRNASHPASVPAREPAPAPNTSATPGSPGPPTPDVPNNQAA